MKLAEILGMMCSAVFVVLGVWMIMSGITSAIKRAERETLRDKVKEIYKDRALFPLKTNDKFYIDIFTVLVGFDPKDYDPKIHNRIIREKALTLSDINKGTLDSMLTILFGIHLQDVMTEVLKSEKPIQNETELNDA